MKPVLLSLFAFLLSLPAVAAESAPELNARSEIIAGLTDVTIEPARRLRGKDFKWDHEIRVALPASYTKTNRPYPVLWLTDGSMYFELATKAVNYDLRRHVPEMIVVAIGTPAAELDDFPRRRSFELTPTKEWGFSGFGSELLDKHLAAVKAAHPGLVGGGAALFLDFLVDEVRPALQRHYRIGADHLLFGDSGGGIFCVYAFLVRPEAFSRYICGSPSLYGGNQELFRLEDRYAKAHQDLKAIVFLGAGEAEMLEKTRIPATGVVSSMARMAEILSQRNYPSLKLEARIFPGEDHASVVPLNLSWGLRSVWQHGE